MGSDDLCNTRLILGLGFPGEHKRSPPQKLRRFSDEPSLTLSLSSDRDQVVHNRGAGVDGLLFRQDSGGSSFSSSVKREIEDEDDDDGSRRRRKKLRLSKAQSSLLEESFKLHTTLNPKQKQELARDLSLRPRQVEVWFQNRRARTKLKQTEVDCESLKKCCETLADENRRLQRELKELKAAQALSMQPARLTIMCSSCEETVEAKGAFVVADPKPNFYNHFFTNSSAAC